MTLLPPVVVGRHDASLDRHGLDPAACRRPEVEVDHRDVVADLAEPAEDLLREVGKGGGFLSEFGLCTIY